MAFAAAMNNQEESSMQDEHEHDMAMPGFRFHPTDEELVEFYLRRKVEGKHFNAELITCLDLYRYDPRELPALAAIAEKEWYFYVPRDKKYRNGDRPNRATTSGYWKATGADRVIRSENLRSIGLKKTLVFYSGKAPKGIRSGWIMNEYRLPQNETEHLQKVEISLCRIYKRARVEKHPLRESKSARKQHGLVETLYGKSCDGKMSKTSQSRSTNIINGTTLAFSRHNSYSTINSSLSVASSIITGQNSVEDDGILLHQSKQECSPTFSCSSSQTIDDLHKLASTCLRQTAVPCHENRKHVTNILSHLPQPPCLEIPGSIHVATTDKLYWDSEATNKE